MNFKLRELGRGEERAAVRFAVRGMHLDRYTSGLALALYVRLFWYHESNRATQRIGAWVGGRFVGALLACMDDEVAPHPSLWRRAYVRLFGWVLRQMGSEDAYDEANARMLAAFRKTASPDGELCFLAADPDEPVPGTGSALLAELERREAGKLIYLFTDDACTYQFYDRRGFERVGEERIELPMGDVRTMTCMLYAKRLGEQATDA